MESIKAIVENKRPTPPSRIYLARIMLGLTESDRLTESYAFAMHFGEYGPEYDYIMQLASPRSAEAARLWTSGPLYDIVVEETLPEQKRRIGEELGKRGRNIFEFHPGLYTSRLIRRQFFARARELEEVASELYPGYRIPSINGSSRSRYERELIEAPRITEFTVLNRSSA